MEGEGDEVGWDGLGRTPSRLGPQHGFLLRSSVSRERLYFWASVIEMSEGGKKKGGRRGKGTDEGFGDGDETRDIELVLGEVEHFERAVPFEDLGDVRDSGLRA